jgi:Kef-type K+ transport system membrane component KefB
MVQGVIINFLTSVLNYLHHLNTLESIGIILGLVAVVTIIARLVRQPPIIAYIVAGILAGPLFLNIISGASDMIQLLSHLGVSFLLFIVGLNLDLRVFKEVGWTSIFAGSAQIIITAVVGFFIAIGLGLNNLTALYLGIVLAFSSTVIVVKILSDKKEMDTLHGRISLGILIVQDLVAAIALMLVPFINSGGTIFTIISRFGFAMLLIVAIFLFSHFVLNRFMNYLAKSQETLFLFGVAWALVLATIFYKQGFSLEIGALVAGISLASSKYNLDLGGKIKPLRDFFIVLFFVFFGSQLTGPITLKLLEMAVIFSLFIIIVKPLIVMSVLRAFGYKKKINFLTGLNLAQISEFSLIVILLGLSLNHLNQEIISLVVLIALITITISSYSIYYSTPIFNKISWLLNIFEGKRKRDEKTKNKSFDIILFGYHRIGFKILSSLKELDSSFVAIDYNPKVILSLNKLGIDSIYGDAGNKEFLKEIPLDKAKIVISTIPDSETNLVIQEMLREANSEAIFIATTEHPNSAIDLYKNGVDYVILPHHLGGDFAAHMIKSFHTDKKKYKEAGNRHMKELTKSRKNSTFSFG